MNFSENLRLRRTGFISEKDKFCHMCHFFERKMNNEAPVEQSCELSNVRLLLLDVQALGYFASILIKGFNAKMLSRSTTYQKGPTGDNRRWPNNSNEGYY